MSCVHSVSLENAIGEGTPSLNTIKNSVLA